MQLPPLYLHYLHIDFLVLLCSFSHSRLQTADGLLQVITLAAEHPLNIFIRTAFLHLTTNTHTVCKVFGLLTEPEVSVYQTACTTHPVSLRHVAAVDRLHAVFQFLRLLDEADTVMKV